MLDIYNIISNFGQEQNHSKSVNIETNNECSIANSEKIERNNKVYFVVTGAMTNLAVLIKAFPSVLDFIEEIVIMGGAVHRGNRTPAAEFNILVDP